MKILKKSVFVLLLNIGFVIAQEQVVKKDSLTVSIEKVEIVNDSLIEAIPLEVENIIEQTVDTLSIKRIDAIDDQWRELFYNLSAYDSISKTINEISFDDSYTTEIKLVNTDTLKKHLSDLNDKSPFHIVYNKSLEQVINSYLKNRRILIEKMLTISDYYFPLFEERLDSHNLPLELKYLPVVESALRPAAKSRVGATGLWQFMYATGKSFGLGVSNYVDDRSNPEKSTEAACKYLDNLYKIFGDWDLALAAYNSGPGNVTKAIRRSGGYKNYWNIRPFLPRETAGYLPAFVTTMYLMEYADFYGFNKKKTHYKFHETDTLKVRDKLSFDILSEKIDMPLELVKYLNPSYKLDIIPNQSHKDFYIRLPFSYVNKFIDLEKDIYKSSIAYLDQKEKYSPQLFDYSSRVYYTVKSGDYLGKIADNFGVRVSEIKKWNGLRNDNVRVGQRLKVFPRRAPKQTVPKKYTGKPKVTYKVVEGDTLWDISKKFPGVSINDIKHRNNLSSTSLNIGTVLVIE